MVVGSAVPRTGAFVGYSQRTAPGGFSTALRQYVVSGPYVRDPRQFYQTLHREEQRLAVRLWSGELAGPDLPTERGPHERRRPGRATAPASTATGVACGGWRRARLVASTSGEGAQEKEPRPTSLRDHRTLEYGALRKLTHLQ